MIPFLLFGLSSGDAIIVPLLRAAVADEEFASCSVASQALYGCTLTVASVNGCTLSEAIVS